ncbi:MAG TPA: hypothetical protein VM054_01530 [bacterium]|nr:hypothetical protein [bacterium]
MKYFVLAILLFVSGACFSDEEPVGAVEVELYKPPFEAWLAVHGGAQTDFAGYFGGSVGATFNWLPGGGGFYLGAGYTYTGGHVGAEGISGELNLNQFMGLIGYGFIESNTVMAVGFHLGLASLSGKLTSGEEEATGSASVFCMGAIGVFDVLLGDTGGIHFEIRTSYLMSKESYSKLYSLHVGYAFAL